MELNKSIFKWLMITNLVLIFLLFGTNIGWFIYESQFRTITTETEEYTQDLDLENGSIDNSTIINVKNQGE